MAEYGKWTIYYLLVIMNLLICCSETNTTKIRTNEIDQLRIKRQFFGNGARTHLFGFSIGPFGSFQGGRYGRNFGFNRFFSRRPRIVRRFWRRRFHRIGDR